MNYWRIRMTYSPTHEDVTQEAWEHGVVGIWYGAWTPKNLKDVEELSADEAARRLSTLPAQRTLGWRIRSQFVNIARHFRNIGEEDWVFVYFNQSIHLGKTSFGIQPKPIALFNRNGELFKAKNVRQCKSFSLSELPEAYRLLASAGRSTVHQIRQANRFIGILAECKDCQSVWKRTEALDWEEWMPALGPKGWESLCLAFLIQEVGFLPTGLGLGGTLPDFDIVGRGRDGRLVLGQCKKGEHVYSVSEGIRAAYENSKNADLYLFAYGGAMNAPANVRVITKQDFRDWFAHSSKGKHYRRLLTGG
jgi:hypothetical protein